MKRLARVLRVSLFAMTVLLPVGATASPAMATSCAYPPTVDELATSPDAVSLVRTRVVLSIPALTSESGWTYVAVPEEGWGTLDDRWQNPVVLRTSWTCIHLEGARTEILVADRGLGPEIMGDTLIRRGADLVTSRFGAARTASPGSFLDVAAIIKALFWYLTALAAGAWATARLARRGRLREAGVLLIAPIGIAIAWLWHPLAWNGLAIVIGTLAVLLALWARGWRWAVKWYGWFWVVTAGMGVTSPINEALGRLPGFPFRTPDAIGEVATRLAPLMLLVMFAIHAFMSINTDRAPAAGTPGAA
jgi:hypothetical protein